MTLIKLLIITVENSNVINGNTHKQKRLFHHTRQCVGRDGVAGRERVATGWLVPV